MWRGKCHIMRRYNFAITCSVLRGVWVLGAVWLLAGGWCIRSRGYLRATVDAQGANSVHSHVAHVHTLAVDLDAATLEVLLVVHAHLDCCGEENDSENVVANVVSKLKLMRVETWFLWKSRSGFRFGKRKWRWCYDSFLHNDWEHKSFTWYFPVSCSCRPPPHWALRSSRLW